MPPDELKIWLKRKRKSGLLGSVAYTVLTLGGGLLISVVMIFLLQGFFQLFAREAFPSSSLARIACWLAATALFGIIMADSIRASRDDLSFLPGWLLREHLDIGPRLILEGWPCVARVRQWARLDVDGCARVLAHLMGKTTPTHRIELGQIFPGLSWFDLVADLQLLEGVIVFRNDGSRITLTTPLRLELRRLFAAPQPAFAGEPQPAPVTEPDRLSAEEILGVPPKASVAEIRTAYRIRIKECHPDRFASMDQQSRSLAEEWTKSLNAAYEALLSRAKAQR